MRTTSLGDYLARYRLGGSLLLPPTLAFRRSSPRPASAYVTTITDTIMRLDFSNLAVTAALLASAATAAGQDIPADLPVSTLLTSAQSHLARGETNEALAYYDAAIAKDPSNYLSLFKRATTYLSLGRSAQASQDFGKVLELKPGFEGAHLQLAKIKSKVADWQGARAEYAAAHRGPDSSEVLELAEAQGAADLAAAAAENQQWEDCVSQAGVAILVASRAPQLRELRSRCRFERGEIEEGMGDLHHVLQLRPGNTDPHVLISATSFYGLGDLTNGVAQIRKCLHSDPDSKVCKALHRQQKQIQKTLTKIEGQLNRGQSTTAGRGLVGTSEEPGLLPLVREQMDELRKEGRIPVNAKAKLYIDLVEMVCQAYSEVCLPFLAPLSPSPCRLSPNSPLGFFPYCSNLEKKKERNVAS